MSIFRSADEFGAQFAAVSTTASAMDLFDDLCEDMGSWSAEQCSTWFGPFLRWLACEEQLGGHFIQAHQQIEADGPLAYEVEVNALRAAETLVARMHSHRAPMAIDALVVLASHESLLGRTIDIPRTQLVKVYLEWVRSGFTPGLCESQEQMRTKATPSDAIQIANAFVTFGTDREDIAFGWIEHALPFAVRLEPERIPAWLDYLEVVLGAEEVFERTTIQHYRTWLNRLPGKGVERRGLCDPRIAAYLASKRPDLTVIADAQAVVARNPDDALPLRHADFLPALLRDGLIAKPPLPAHLTHVGDEQVQQILRDYLTLEAVRQVGRLTGCALLTLAVETHLRNVLAAGMGSREQQALRCLGLTALKRFVEGGSVSGMEQLRVRGSLEADAKAALDSAARIRDTVHHAAFRLRDDDLRHLRSDVLAADGRGLLVAVRGLSCGGRV